MNYDISQNDSDFSDDTKDLSYILLLFAGVIAVSCFMFVFCLHLVGQKVSYEFRWRYTTHQFKSHQTNIVFLVYLKAILTKDTEWFESQSLEELPTKVHTYLNEIENSSGKTLGFIIYSVTAWIAGIVFAFLLGALYCWCLLFYPLVIVIIGGFSTNAVQKINEQDEKNFIRTGADLEQTLNAITDKFYLYNQ